MIRLLPLDQLEADAAASGASAAEALTSRRRPAAAGLDPLGWAQHRRFTTSGRAALDTVLRALSLAPADEVFITNSSGQLWISPCVTCTVFNHCRPSRVLTDRTRAILVIHEYGYPHPELEELVAEARRRGLPLIEDCAHSLDSAAGERPLGSFGDFAIFSLSKVLPVRSGGVLVGPVDGGAELAGVEQLYREQVGALPLLSRRRRENYDAIRTSFPRLPLLLEAGPWVTPSCVGLLTPHAPRIRAGSTAVEWASTLEEELLLVPTNPLVDSETLVSAVAGAFELEACA